MTTLSRRELVERIAARVELPRPEVAHVLDALAIETKQALEAGQRVRIPGLGLATLYTRPARTQQVPGQGFVTVPPRTAVKIRLISALASPLPLGEGQGEGIKNNSPEGSTNE